MFGEISIFYLIVALEGTYFERIPNKLRVKFECETKQFDEEYDDICHGFIFIKTLNGKSIKIECSLKDTVSRIKKRIKDKEGLQIEDQRLIYSGKQLQDDQTLIDCDCSYNCTLHLVTRLR